MVELYLCRGVSSKCVIISCAVVERLGRLLWVLAPKSVPNYLRCASGGWMYPPVAFTLTPYCSAPCATPPDPTPSPFSLPSAGCSAFRSFNVFTPQLLRRMGVWGRIALPFLTCPFEVLIKPSTGYLGLAGLRVHVRMPHIQEMEMRGSKLGVMLWVPSPRNTELENSPQITKCWHMNNSVAQNHSNTDMPL